MRIYITCFQKFFSVPSLNLQEAISIAASLLQLCHHHELETENALFQAFYTEARIHFRPSTYTLFYFYVCCRIRTTHPERQMHIHQFLFQICNILYNIDLWNIIKTNHNDKHIFMILCISLSGTDTLNSKRMHPVFEDPISSFTSTATREGSSVAHLYLLFALQNALSDINEAYNTEKRSIRQILDLRRYASIPLLKYLA